MADAPPSFLDAALCPLCGQANRCAMETQRESGISQPPCWCTRVSFDRATLERVPAAARGLACLCSACAARDRAA